MGGAQTTTRLLRKGLPKMKRWIYSILVVLALSAVYGELERQDRQIESEFTNGQAR